MGSIISPPETVPPGATSGAEVAFGRR